MLEKRIIELLTRKMAGELLPDEFLELNNILSSYPEALQEEEVFKKIWDSAPEGEDIASFYERHIKRHKEELIFDSKSSELLVKKYRWKRFLAVTSVALIIVSATYFIYGYSSTPKDSYKQIIAGKGVRKLMILPDGTKVWLNADSKLSYDPQMTTAKQRLVNLAGEAFFDVAHDREHPFIINANKVSVKVLGTAFNIKAYPEDKKCETTLLRGSVELTINDGSKQKFILKPSEKIAVIDEEVEDKAEKKQEYERKGKTLLIEHIKAIKEANKEYIPETSWTENRLVFENETLKEIAVKLERWYNVKINIENDVAGSYHFTGPFTNETIEQVLNALQLIQPFNFKINNNDITIY